MNPGRAPVIGVTGPDRGGWPAWIFTALAIRAAGGVPRRITPSRPHPGPLDGLVLGGGADVSEPLGLSGPRDVAPSPPPSRLWLLRLVDVLIAPLVFLIRWLGSRSDDGPRLDRARDRTEYLLLEIAEERGLPVLGICRGAQLMNLARGGTLIRNLDQVYVERPNFDTIAPRRPVVVDAHCNLSSWLGREALHVNSLHRHAVDEPGARLEVVARDDSGVVQAIEDGSRPFWVGVQWHPEYMPQRHEQRQLFRALVEASRASVSRPPAPELVSDAAEAAPLRTSAA